MLQYAFLQVLTVLEELYFVGESYLDHVYNLLLREQMYAFNGYRYRISSFCMDN